MRFNQCENMWKIMLTKRRDSFGGSQFLQNGNATAKTPIKINANNLTILQFDTDVSDSVGTLAVEIAILNSPSMADSSVFGCLSHGYGSILDFEKCENGRKLQQISKKNDVSTVSEQVLILYPSPGTWYLTLSARCHHTVSCSVPLLFSVHTNHCFSGLCGRYGKCQARDFRQ